MDQFSIKDLERLSGINAHTIRIWERRYGLMDPMRTTTNRRVYSGEDLRRIISIGILNRSGLKVSKIACLTNEELDRMVSEQLESSALVTDETERLLVAMLEVDNGSAKKILRESLESRGFEATIEEIIFPFIRRVGDLWQTGTINPGHEHFISNIFRNQLITAMESSLPFPEAGSASAILFLPENEMHELPLLLYDYIFRKSGYETIYLGQMTPIESVILLAEKRNPEFIVTGASTSLPPKPMKFIRSLSQALPQCRIIVAGNLASLKSVAGLSNVTAVGSIAKLRKVIGRASKA
ncbi:MAG: MerR family transcriptional regulator [Bacteroidales bacterium]